MQLRDYQERIRDQAYEIILKLGIAYLALEPRVGKTITSLSLAKKLGSKKVCFITKKKAISSIESDYSKSGISFDEFIAVNYEQTHKLNPIYDLYICDEAHCLGQYAKPSNRTKQLKSIIGSTRVILLSGTPNPESFSQIYHQFWISAHGPFVKYKTFYQWARDYVNVKKKYIRSMQINDYSEAKAEMVKGAIEPYMVTLSQQEAGFTSFVDEEILYVPIDERIYKVMARLKKDKLYTMKSGDVILCDTPVKMQSVFHQLSSGTLKIDETKRVTIDESKAWFIKSRFAGQKIAIFYKFIQEGEVLRKVFPDNTDSPEEFNKHDHLTFICQIVSGREGTNLSTSDALVMYNIDFSAVSYWQSRARMQTHGRTKASKLYWIFSERGLEKFVHRAVVKKQNYTKDYFVKDIKLIGQ